METPQGPFAGYWCRNGEVPDSVMPNEQFGEFNDIVNEMALRREGVIKRNVFGEVFTTNEDPGELKSFLMLWAGSAYLDMNPLKPDYIAFFKGPQEIVIASKEVYNPATRTLREDHGVNSEPTGIHDQDEEQGITDFIETNKTLELPPVEYEEHDDSLSEEDRKMLDEIRNMRDYYSTDERSFFNAPRTAVVNGVKSYDGEKTNFRHVFEVSPYIVFRASNIQESKPVKWCFPSPDEGLLRIEHAYSTAPENIKQAALDYVRSNMNEREDGCFDVPALLVSAMDYSLLYDQETKIITGAQEGTYRVGTKRTLTGEHWNHLGFTIILPEVSETGVDISFPEVQIEGVSHLNIAALVEMYRGE